MHLLVVASIDPAHHTGGAERVAALLAERLSHEHEVTVASLAEPGSPEEPQTPWRRRAVPVDAPYHPAEHEAASPLERARWQLGELYSPTSADRVSDLLDEEDVDVASVHNVQGLSFGLFDVLGDHGVPTAYTIHDFKLSSPALNRRPDGFGRLASPLFPLYRAWTRRRTRHVDRFLSPSHYVAGELEEDGVVDPGRLEIVPNGVPVDVPHTTQDPGPRIVGYGALAPHKGLATFAEAFHASEAELELVLAGTGPVEDRIQALAAEDERITFAGYLPQRELETLLSDALATVVPSRWPENCPMVVLESLAAGTPVLHTGRGGLDELAPDGERGLVLPEAVSDWPERIERLDNDRLAKMRPACRRAAETAYSLERMAEAYEQTFQLLAGRSG